MTNDFSTSKRKGRLYEIPLKNAALLVGFYRSSKEKQSAEEHLDELERLADTFGLQDSYKIAAPLRKIEAATYLGKGKLEELKEFVEENPCEVVIFDEEISPQQQRNIEKKLKIPVIDRTELILGVFAQRAHTKEAKIQVQLASFRYQLPRLKRLWTHLERQRTGGRSGKGGYLKGAGERQIEIDRRLIKDRISRLEKELKEVIKQRKTQRAARKRTHIPIFALVGYTNAGKSTLLNALTKAGVFTEDKLFATLDTTTRKFYLPNKQEILLIDTVGFIRKLPHQLVAAFKSTLEEVQFADAILHVVDGSSDHAFEQAETTLEILKELKVGKKPVITLLNKIDKNKSKVATKVKFSFSPTVEISALKKKGFKELEKKMMQELSKLRQKGTFCFDQKDYKRYAHLAKEAHIISTEYEKNMIIVEAELPRSLWERFEPYLC